MLKLNKKGVTLIELIVSFALVATAVIYFYQTLSTVYDLYVTSKKETQEYVDKDYAMRIVDAYVNEYGSDNLGDICGTYIDCNSVDFNNVDISNINIITIYKDREEWIKYYIPNNLIEIIGNKIEEFLANGEGGFDDIVNDINDGSFSLEGIESANIKPIIKKDDLGNDVIYGTIYIKLDNGWEGVVTSEGEVILKHLYYIDDVENNISNIIEENYDKKTEDVENTILSEYNEIFDDVEYLRNSTNDSIKLKFGEEVLHTYIKPFKLVDINNNEITSISINNNGTWGTINYGWTKWYQTYYFNVDKYRNIDVKFKVTTSDPDMHCSLAPNWISGADNNIYSGYNNYKDTNALEVKFTNSSFSRNENQDTSKVDIDSSNKYITYHFGNDVSAPYGGLGILSFNDNTSGNSYTCNFELIEIKRR